VKQLSERIEYKALGDGNQLRLWKRIVPQPA
jgi:hypothetical protein